MSNPTLTKSNDADYYPERYLGYDDGGGVHWNSGIMNLAFVLMVQGGTHPRGKTTVNVPAIDPDFDVSLLAAARIFYLANTACLTPMSGFNDVRKCTILHAGAHAASVEAAWDAVGVNPLPLAPGTPSTGLAANRSAVIDFIPFAVDAGTSVTCTLDGDNGDADLYISMSAGGFDYASCQSLSFGSQEACSVGPLGYKGLASVRVKAYKAFTGLTLSCTLQEALELQDGVPVTDQQAEPSDTLAYIFPDIAPLQSITCSIDSDLGMPSLYAYAISDDGSVYEGCYLGSNDYEEGFASCTITPLTATTSLFVTMSSYDEKFSNATLTCSLGSVITTLSNWVTVLDKNLTIYDSGYNSTFIESYYALDTTVEPTERVTCLVKGSSKNLYSELTLYYGNATHLTETCFGYSLGVSECTGNRTETSTNAYAKLSIYPYSNSDDDAAGGDDGLSTSAPALPPLANANISAQILCGVDHDAVDLSNGVSVINLSGQAGTDSALNFYRLKGVRRGEKVTCTIGGSSITGTPALYVRSIQRPHPMSTLNDCKKSQTTNTCTTLALPFDSVVYAAIHAVTDYSGLSLICTRDASSCGALGAKCKRARDCCGSTTTCDGTNANNRKCKVGRVKGSICSRNSQCRPGSKCNKNKCT